MRWMKEMWLQRMKSHQHASYTILADSSRWWSDPTCMVELAKFHTQLYTQMESKAVESQPDSTEDDVSDTEPVSSGSEDEEAYPHRYSGLCV